MGVRERLRKLRRERRLTLAEVAKATGFSLSYIQKVEKGHSEWSRALLEKMASFYGIPVSCFFEEATDQKVPILSLPGLSPDVVEFLRREDAGAYVLVAKELAEQGLTSEQIKAIGEILLKTLPIAAQNRQNDKQ